VARMKNERIDSALGGEQAGGHTGRATRPGEASDSAGRGGLRFAPCPKTILECTLESAGKVMRDLSDASISPEAVQNASKASAASRAFGEVKYVFVCGMPRSGTTILAREIARLANCTGFENTGVMMDEGQYLQDVYPTEWACGGAGRFGFAPQAHLTEESPLLASTNVARLRQSWEPYWDSSKAIRVEKTPGNLLKTRFLQAAFPNAYFVVVKRHPVAVSLAVQKWSLTPLHELFEHWLRCHELFDEDKKWLERSYVLSYEDYIKDPKQRVAEIADFIGTRFSGSLAADAADVHNQKYFDRWAHMLQSSPFRSYYRLVAREYDPRFAEHGYSLAPSPSKTPFLLSRRETNVRACHPFAVLRAGSERSEGSQYLRKPPPRGILTRLLYLATGAFFAVWRAGRSFRIRIEHGTGFRPLVSVREKSNSPGRSAGRLRVLVLAPGCNPEGITIPLEGYCHAEALARLHDVTLVTGPSSEEALRRAQAPFRAIEVIRQPWLQRVQAFALRRVFKFNYRSQVLTAFGVPFSLAFEWGAWRQLRRHIFAGEFDVVLRLLPLNTVCPSPFAFFLRNGPVPFVLGPLNGGLPWPEGFSQADNQKEWASRFRGLYRFLPFARSTYRYATAIIAGSSHTYAECGVHQDKLFYVPENGLSHSLCSDIVRSSERNGKLELIFVGGLVPYKACDLALRAAAPLLRSDLARFTVVGDGPERNRLEQLTKSLGIEKAVSFRGWLSHDEVQQRLQSADVLVFPSVHEFGGAVVVEALVAGAVPVVADFGGPGDNVRPDVGFKVALSSEEDVVSQIGRILTRLAHDRVLLEHLRQRGMCYARESLTWDAKAQTLTRILNWAVRRGPKPDLPPPKMLYLERAS
jgi:glycosyltransferase involved in cell wall biosynthesis